MEKEGKTSLRRQNNFTLEHVKLELLEKHPKSGAGQVGMAV